MSRIRSVHPGLWTDENFVTLSPMARLLFIGIWNECDDQGVFVWSPLQLKMRLLPADNVDAAELLAEIACAGRVMRFEAGGKSYGAVRNFQLFQRPKKPNAIHPLSPEAAKFVAGGGEDAACGSGDSSELGSVEEPQVRNRFPTNGEKPPQMEDGGGIGGEEQPIGCSARAPARELKSPKPRKSAIPSDWEPGRFGEGSKCRGIVDAWPPGEGAAQLERFVAHHTARGNRFENWQAAWKTWVLNSEEFGHGRQANGNGHAAPRDRRDGVAQALDRRLGFDEPAGQVERRDAGDGGGGGEDLPRLAALR